jgi:hypothetical protein
VKSVCVCVRIKVARRSEKCQPYSKDITAAHDAMKIGVEFEDAAPAEANADAVVAEAGL